jgi:hypothetical protein
VLVWWTGLKSSTCIDSQKKGRLKNHGSLASCSYNALGNGPGAHRAEFEITFKQATELIGHMKLKIFMAAEGADDMDVFVGRYKFDARGNFVLFAYYSFLDDGPVALG